jgi:hypothetical protein
MIDDSVHKLRLRLEPRRPGTKKPMASGGELGLFFEQPSIALSRDFQNNDTMVSTNHDQKS